jgi:hypothetical protein
MDAKELENPAHVYREVEPILKGTGDINRWKDYTGRLRSNPDYNVDDEQHALNMAKIKVHKLCLLPLKEMNDALQTMKLITDAGHEHFFSNMETVNQAVESIEKFSDQAHIIYTSVSYMTYVFKTPVAQKYLMDMTASLKITMRLLLKLRDMCVNAKRILVPGYPDRIEASTFYDTFEGYYEQAQNFMEAVESNK